MILSKDQIRHIHLVGICGTAMGALAGMLKSGGYRVTGSDSGVYEPMSTFLRALEIQVFEGFCSSNLNPPPDLVVIGNVISRGNSEVEEVLNRKIRYASMPEALKDFFIRGKRSFVVTGTHGKTTTTSLLAWVIESSGRDSSFMVGGIPLNFNAGYKLGEGEDFIIEGDEYDTAFFDKGPKFLHYLPDVVIINGIEFDHADIYRDLDQIKTSFGRLINIIPSDGLLVASADDENVSQLIPNAFCQVRTFGFSKNADWRAENMGFKPRGVSFDVSGYGNFFIPLIGEHNVRNTLAVIATADFIGLSREQIKRGLSTFKCVKRRLEIRGVVDGITVIDDFAHHPTSVKETLRGLRKSNPKVRIWALFEPASATNARSVFEERYNEAFDCADKIVLAKVPKPERAGEDEKMSMQRVARTLRNSGKDALYIPEVDDIVENLKEKLMKGDIVLVMTNGSFGGIHDKILNVLTSVKNDTQAAAART